MKSVVALSGIGVLSMCAALLVACGDASDGQGAQGSSSSALSPAEDDGGVVSTADAGDEAGYFACQGDSDCVAVKYFARCCYNGWKIAVAQSEVEAYESATACPRVERVCPLYVVDDTRVPVCQAGTCAMVAPPADDGGSTTPAQQ